jgi:hypothetical protein
VSVRLPQSTVSRLQEEAGSKGITFSDLAKEVLTNHATWGAYSSRVPTLPVPPALIVQMLDRLPEAEIASLGRESGKLVISQLGDTIAGQAGLETLLMLLKAWLENSRMTVTYTSGDRFSCIVLHGMGRKWSIYLANLVASVLKDASVRRRFQFEANEKSLGFTIILPHQF